MIPLGELIWVSIQPLVRLFLCVAAGFIISKSGLFPAVAARAAGEMILNITLPNLVFSRIVLSFGSSEVGALGPLILVALLYEAIGISISWIIKQLFWVPHRFRYGILVAGGWSNVGDVPTSVMMSLMAASPFNGTSDQNLAVAYISVFLLIFLITLFPLGGAHLVSLDFCGPDVTDEEMQERLKIRQRYLYAATERAVIASKGLFYSRSQVEGYDNEKIGSDPPISSVPTSDSDAISATTTIHHTTNVTEAGNERLRHRLIRLISTFFRTLVTPCSLSIILAFIIAIVPDLKALFVPDVSGVTMPSAPDGQPPLAILLNTATFIGDASVPLGLMTLGSALARLEIPNGHFCALPFGAVIALAISRMVIMPVLGVLITQGLTRAGLLDGKDNVLRFVCIFMSCLPTATAQVILTQVYSGTGNAQHLSVFLIPQYVLMFITMTALTVYTLHLLFG